MVGACGKYGQKGVDGASKWRAGERHTEVGRMDGVKVAWATDE